MEGSNIDSEMKSQGDLERVVEGFGQNVKDEIAVTYVDVQGVLRNPRKYRLV